MTTEQRRYPLARFQLEFLPLDHPLRDKTDIMALWMKAVKLLSHYSPTTKTTVANLVLLTGDTRRLVVDLMSSNLRQCFSVHFPFHTYQGSDGGLHFRTNGGCEIDGKISSEILGILADESSGFQSGSVLDLIDDVEADGSSTTLWEVFRELLLADEGYLRFEDDVANASASHPRYHFDFFRTDASSLKVGTGKPLALAEVCTMVRADGLFGTLQH